MILLNVFKASPPCPVPNIYHTHYYYLLVCLLYQNVTSLEQRACPSCLINTVPSSSRYRVDVLKC